MKLNWKGSSKVLESGCWKTYQSSLYNRSSRCLERDVVLETWWLLGLGEQHDIRRFLISWSTSNGPQSNGRTSPASTPGEAPHQPTDRPPPSATPIQSRKQGILRYYGQDNCKDLWRKGKEGLWVSRRHASGLQLKSSATRTKAGRNQQFVFLNCRHSLWNITN